MKLEMKFHKIVIFLLHEVFNTIVTVVVNVFVDCIYPYLQFYSCEFHYMLITLFVKQCGYVRSD